MDRLEQDLRSTLTEDRLSLPVRPDALSLLHTGVRRRRRNRVIATASAAVVLVAGGVTAGSLASRNNSGPEDVFGPAIGVTPTPAPKPSLPAPSSDEIPWTATVYDYHHPPAFPGTVADPSVPWCRSDQLTLSQQFQGAGGSLVGSADVTNTSTKVCALQGQPTVSMVATDGTTLLTSHPEPFYVDAWVRVPPGRSANAPVVWSPQFCHTVGVGSMRVALPHDGGSLITAMSGNPRCDIDTVRPFVGHLDVDGFVAGSTDPFTPEAGLAASISKADTSVAPGATLDYKLQLQSMAAPSMTLDPCLPYRERLVDHATQHVLIEEDHLLNCSGAGPITDPPSNHDTFFALQLAVPTNAPEGDYDLLWQSVLKPVAAAGDQLVHVTAPLPACRDGQLTATAGPGGAATGHYGLDIVFHNISSSPCALRGYPGVVLLDRAGHEMTPAPRRGSAFVFNDPGPSTVVLAAATGTASFGIGGEDYDPVHQRECPSATHIAVYAPGTRARLIVASGFPVCPWGDTFSAVVSGTQGPRD